MARHLLGTHRPESMHGSLRGPRLSWKLTSRSSESLRCTSGAAKALRRVPRRSPACEVLTSSTRAAVDPRSSSFEVFQVPDGHLFALRLLLKPGIRPQCCEGEGTRPGHSTKSPGLINRRTPRCGKCTSASMRPDTHLMHFVFSSGPLPTRCWRT